MIDPNKSINDHHLSLTKKEIEDHNSQCLVRSLKDARHLADLFSDAYSTNKEWLKTSIAIEKTIREINENCRDLLLRDVTKTDASLLNRAINQQYSWDVDYQLFRFVLIEKGCE